MNHAMSMASTLSQIAQSKAALAVQRLRAALLVKIS